MVKISQKIKAIISFFIILIAVGYGLFNHRNPLSRPLSSVETDIVFTGNQNDTSLYNEMWIYNFVIDGEIVSATEFGIPEGWEEYAGYLHVYGDPATKQPLHISIPNCSSASVRFATGNSSGIALLRSETESKEIDLYSEQNSEIVQSMIFDTAAEHNQQEIKVAIVFLIAAILLLVIHFDIVTIRIMKPQIVAIVIIIGVVIGFFGVSGQRFDTYNYDTTISVLDTKNEASTGYNAAFNCIYVNDQAFSVTDIDSNIDGWTQYENVVWTINENPSSIHIKAENVRSIVLDIQKNNSYGIIELQTGNNKETIDLYSAELTSNTVTLEPVEKYQPNFLICTLWAIFGGIISLLCAIWIEKKDRMSAFIPQILCYVLIIQARFIMFSFNVNVAWTILSVIFGMLLGYGIEKLQSFVERTTKEKVIVILLGVYFAFAFIGQPVLLEMYTVNLSISSLTFFAAMSFFGICITTSIVILFRILGEKIHKKVYKYNKNCYWIVFVAMSAVFLVSFLMLVPVVTSDDTRAINMAMGNIPYNELYPYYRMIYLRFLTLIDPTQHLFASIQVLLFIAVSSLWFAKLHRKGLSIKLTVITSILFVLCPPNFINQMTSVRDYMCATAILFIGYVISEYTDKRDDIFKISKVVCMFLALFVLMFFRSNGFLAGIMIIITFAILIMRSKWFVKKGITALVIISIFIGIAQGALPYLTVGAEHSTVKNQLQIMVCENYSGILASGKKLSKETTERLRKLAPDEVWEEWYLPYNMKAYPNADESIVVDNLSTRDSIKLLIESFVKAPLITIKNRLNKTNHGWDMTRVENYWAGVFIDSYQPQDLVEPNDSIFNQIFDKLFSTREYQYILRITSTYGIWLYLLVVSIYTAWREKQLAIASMTIPMWCYLITMLAACSWQDQRFYYHILPFAFFMIMEAIVGKSQNENYMLFTVEDK